MTWRKKMMRLEDWKPLQDRFEQHQLMHLGDPELAMFCQGRAADGLTAIYIHGPALHVIELGSPGGWEDADCPQGDDVSLLVGTADAFERFRINQ